MAEAQTSTVILKVTLDEGKTEEQLKQLVLDIEATKKAQASLTAERKLGLIADDDFAKKTVDLKTQLKGQQVEQTALTKNLELYRTATGDLANTYKGTQAQLSLAQRQYQELQGSQNSSTESTKVLGATIESLRSTLAKTDETQGLFVRNIGNYPKGESLEPLIQQLVHLQEVQKTLPAGSQAAADAQKQIGFQYGQINAQAAAAGKSADDVQNKLKGYGEAVRPAISNLVQLEKAQDEVAKSAGKESAEFAKIGFQIGATRKEIAAVPPELAKIPTTAETATKALQDTANKGMGLFGVETNKATSLLGKFKSGSDLVKTGLAQIKGAGETGSLGLKAIAGGIALTGIGLFVIAISAVVTYFTQSAEGAKLLAQGMAALGAVVQVALDVVVEFGKGIVYAVTHPIEAISKLGDALTNALLHPIDTARGLGDAVARVGAKAVAAAKDAASLVAEQKALAKERRQLEIDEVKEQSRVNVLLRLSKERGKSATEQLESLKEAGRLEAELTEKNIALQQKELDAINRAIKLKGTAKAADLIIDKANKEKEIAQTLAAQDETNAKIQVRESVFVQKQQADALAAQKARAAKVLEMQQDAVKQQITLLEIALAGERAGSEKELQLREQIITKKGELEGIGEKKTAADRALIQAQALVEIGKLEDDYEQKKQDNARKFLDDQLKSDQLRISSAQHVVDEKKAVDTAAYRTDLAMLDRNLEQRRLALETDYATGAISKQQYESRLNVIEQGGLSARLLLAKHHNQDVTAADAAVTRAHNAELLKRTEKEREEYEKRTGIAVEFGQQIGSLFVQTLSETGASLQDFAAKALILILDVLEKQVLAQQAAATAASLAQPDSVATFGASGLLRAAIINALITAAFEGAKALISTSNATQFAAGTVLGGPSHANGGVQLFSPAGHHYGEAEGGEVVLTKGVWASPLLRPMASMLNVMGGGKALLPSSHMAAGGVTTAFAREQLGGVPAPAFDYARLAAALKKVNLSVSVRDTKAAAQRDAFTQSLANG